MIDNHLSGTLFDLSNNTDTIKIFNCLFVNNQIDNGFLIDIDTDIDFQNNLVLGTKSNTTINVIISI